MKWFMYIVAGITTAVLLSGCTGINGLAKALAKDPATVSAKITTPWGTGSLVRVGGQTNNSVSVAPDGTVVIKPGQ